MERLTDQLDRLLGLQALWQENKSDTWGTPLGFKSFDRITGGLHPAEVLILAARTSHGKTALANQIAFNIVMDIAKKIREPAQLIMFSPEMSSNMILLRQACAMARVPSVKIRTGRATEQEIEAFKLSIEILRSLDKYMTIICGRQLSAAEITTYVETAKATGLPIAGVVIDYLQYLDSMGLASYEAYSRNSKEIRVMANRLEVPVLLMAQLSRAAAKRANSDDPDDALPQLEDLEGSGKIEQHADTIALMHRPNVITDDQTQAQKAIIAVRKNRNGEVGVFNLFYYPFITLFKDPLDDLHEVAI